MVYEEVESILTCSHCSLSLLKRSTKEGTRASRSFPRDLREFRKEPPSELNREIAAMIFVNWSRRSERMRQPSYTIMSNERMVINVPFPLVRALSASFLIL